MKNKRRLAMREADPMASATRGVKAPLEDHEELLEASQNEQSTQ